MPSLTHAIERRQPVQDSPRPPYPYYDRRRVGMWEILYASPETTATPAPRSQRHSALAPIALFIIGGVLGAVISIVVAIRLASPAHTVFTKAEYGWERFHRTLP